MLAGLVLDRRHALALLRAGDDRDRLAGGGLGLGVGGLDRLDVVAVDRDRLPAEGLDAAHVAVEVPAEHRLARLAEAVDVDDRGQVVEPSQPACWKASHIEPSAISESPHSTHTR